MTKKEDNMRYVIFWMGVVVAWLAGGIGIGVASGAIFGFNDISILTSFFGGLFWGLALGAVGTFIYEEFID